MLSCLIVVSYTLRPSGFKAIIKSIFKTKWVSVKAGTPPGTPGTHPEHPEPHPEHPEPHPEHAGIRAIRFALNSG